MSSSSFFKFPWYIVFSCLSKSIYLFSLSISPMVSLYFLSFYIKCVSYNINLFLKIAHFGEHNFDFTILWLFPKLCDWCFKCCHLILKSRLNSFQSHKISSFPLIFLCIMVSLHLHFLSLIESWPTLWVNWETLWMFRPRHTV